MKLATIWSFVAGDSRLAPIGVVLAVVVTTLLVRYVPALGEVTGAIFVAMIGASLVAGVFERV